MSRECTYIVLPCGELPEAVPDAFFLAGRTRAQEGVHCFVWRRENQHELLKGMTRHVRVIQPVPRDVKVEIPEEEPLVPNRQHLKTRHPVCIGGLRDDDSFEVPRVSCLSFITEDSGDCMTSTWEVLKHARSEVPAQCCCLLYTSDAADDLLCVDLGGRRIIKK